MVTEVDLEVQDEDLLVQEIVDQDQVEDTEAQVEVLDLEGEAVLDKEIIVNP